LAAERSFELESLSKRENGGSLMLVLTRKSHESVVIGGTDNLHRIMKVTVLSIQGRNVQLGFEVDSDVPVHRSEVWERIRSETDLTDQRPLAL
jgi:carbon storage regulator